MPETEFLADDLWVLLRALRIDCEADLPDGLNTTALVPFR
jgi:hypothetical protein